MIAADEKTIAVSAVDAMLALTNDGTATELGVVGALPENSSIFKKFLVLAPLASGISHRRIYTSSNMTAAHTCVRHTVLCR